MEIEVSATGRFKKYIPEPKTMNVTENITLLEFKELCGLKPTEAVCYIVNGGIKRGADTLQDGDKITFLTMVGAG